MTTIDNGGPAFPLQSIGPDFSPGYAGMSLRDYFAAAAMQGLLAHHGVYEEDAHHYSLCSKKESRRRESAVPNEMAADYAYRVADAMLDARKEAS